jgi:hypothetical protein
LLGGFVLQARSMPWLTWPLVRFPAGMYPFGHELDHVTAETLREMRR